MDQPKIVGLCGAIGSGKSTVAEHLEERGFGRCLGFANRLKLVVLDVYAPMGMEHRHVFGTQADKREPIPGILGPDGEPTCGRALLQTIGTEGFRAAAPTTWVDHLLETTGDAPVVVEDVRFPNEFAGIRARGGVVWEVVRVNGPPQERTGHTSDEAWRNELVDDFVSAPFGDLAALRASVDEALARNLRVAR